MGEQFETGVLAAIWRYRVMCLVIILLVADGAFLVAYFNQSGTTATATIGLRAPDSNNVIAPGIQGDASFGRYTAQRSRFVTGDEVMTAVAEKLDDNDVAALRQNVSATASTTSNVVTITAKADNAREAIALARAVVTSYGEQTRVQVATAADSAVTAINGQIQALIDESESESAVSTLNQLRLRVADIRASQSIFGDGVEFVVQANDETVVEPALPFREGIIGLLVGIILAAAVAWIRADNDPRVERPEQAEQLLKRGMLARLGAKSSRLGTSPNDLRALPNPDFRRLWTAVSGRVRSGVILVQPVGNTPSTPTVINLAAAAAREGTRTLVVDGAPVSRHLSTVFNRPGSSGLTDIVRWNRGWHDEVVAINLQDGAGFGLISAGSFGDEVDASVDRVEALVDEWRSDYEYVLIDADSSTVGYLGSRFAGAVDLVLLVVAHRADQAELLEAMRAAEANEATMVGFAYSDAVRRRPPQRAAGRPQGASARPAKAESAGEPAAVGGRKAKKS